MIVAGYGETLKYPDLPCINVSRSKKGEFFPMEVCELCPGEPFRGALDGPGVKAMIRLACNPPNMNVASILDEGLPKLGFKGQSEAMKRFSVEIESTMALIPARYLPPPKVDNARLANGSWDVRKIKVHRGATLKKWAVLVAQDGGEKDFVNSDDSVFTKILGDFANRCATSGINITQRRPTTIRFIERLPKDSRNGLREESLGVIKRELDAITAIAIPDLVLVFLSSIEKHIYPGIKKLCDVTLGVRTQCVLIPTIRSELKGTTNVDSKQRDMYLANLALKINAKLGGTNHKLDEVSLKWLKDTMLVGVDVTHPGYGTKDGTPSIVAMVASCDYTFMQYPAGIALREPRKEVRALPL